MLTENDEVELETFAVDCCKISKTDKELKYLSLKTVIKGRKVEDCTEIS